MSTVTLYRIRWKHYDVGVFRKQGKGGEGTSYMYEHDKKLHDDICDKHRAFPTPWEDDNLLERIPRAFKHYRHAFLCEDDLYKWFNYKWLKELSSIGFIVVKLTVPLDKVTLGSCQALYEAGTCLFEEDITDYCLQKAS